VPGRSHPGYAAEPFDSGRYPIVISGDDHGIHAARAGGAPVHMFDHRLTGDIGERLAWKPGGCVAGGDDSDDSSLVGRSPEGIQERAGVHDES
jgi:hypothetical protein